MEKINFIPFLSKTPTKINVSGFSMKPFLEENDRVVVVSATKENIDEGDIVVFRREGRDYVHRVVLIEGERFYEIGDNQGTGNWETFNQPLAKVLMVEKNDGRKIDLSEERQRKLAKKIACFQKIRYKRFELKKKIKFKPFLFFTSKYYRIREFFVKPKGILEERN